MREELGSSLDPETAHVGVTDVLDTPEAGRRVVRGGAIRVAGFVAGTGAAVLGAALVTRHLGPEDYGRFQTVIALVTIVYSITDLGMTTLALREYVQRSGAERWQFMRALIGLRLALTVVGTALAVVLALALGYDREMVIGAAVMGAGVLIGVMAATISTPLAAEIRMGVVTGLDLGRQILTTVAYVSLVLVGTGIVPFLAVVVPVNLLVLAVTLPLVRGQVPLRPSFALPEWVSLARPTLTFGLATTAGVLYTYAALVLASLVTSKYETGLFAAAFRVFAIVAAVPGILVTTAFPVLSRAARDDRTRLKYASQRLFEGTALLGGAALVGCVLGAAPVIQIIAGTDYADAVPVLRVIGISLALTCVIASLGFTLLAAHRHRAMVMANLVALSVSATTVLLLAHGHGAMGAVFGTLFGEMALALGYAVGLTRSEGGSLRPHVARAIRVLPAVALALCCWWLPVPELVSTTFGLIVFGVVALGIGAVPNELREHLPGPLRRFGLSGPDEG